MAKHRISPPTTANGASVWGCKVAVAQEPSFDPRPKPADRSDPIGDQPDDHLTSPPAALQPEHTPLDDSVAKFWNRRPEPINQTTVGRDQAVVAFDHLRDDPQVVLVDLQRFGGRAIFPILKPARRTAA